MKKKTSPEYGTWLLKVFNQNWMMVIQSQIIQSCPCNMLYNRYYWLDLGGIRWFGSQEPKYMIIHHAVNRKPTITLLNSTSCTVILNIPTTPASNTDFFFVFTKENWCLFAASKADSGEWNLRFQSVIT